MENAVLIGLSAGPRAHGERKDHVMMLADFRGREPIIDALWKKRGLN
jgi:hypothetical protein